MHTLARMSMTSSLWRLSSIADKCERQFGPADLPRTRFRRMSAFIYFLRPPAVAHCHEWPLVPPSLRSCNLDELEFDNR